MNYRIVHHISLTLPRLCSPTSIKLIARSSSSACGERPSEELLRQAFGSLYSEYKNDDALYADAVGLLNTLQTGRRLREQGKRHCGSGKERTDLWLKVLGYDVSTISRPKVLHVAGTKGKGTTCYYCNQILCEYQRLRGKPHKIGCYTSPHQTEVRERIQINSQPISKSDFTRYFLMLWTNLHSLSKRTDLETPSIPGYPSFLTLLAIYIFLSENVDVAIIETGVGGERDFTKVFPNPVATGIATIELEYTWVLGDTIQEISQHKAGIFKNDCRALAVAQREEVLTILRKRAEEVRTQDGLELVMDQKVIDYNIVVEPNRQYQRLNASLAMSLAEIYLKTIETEFVMTEMLASSITRASLPGRCQIKDDRSSTWFLSTAHNSVSLLETIDWFQEASKTYADAPKVLLFSHNSQRDAAALLNTLYSALNVGEPASFAAEIFCPDQWGQNIAAIPDLVDLRRRPEAASDLQVAKSHADTWYSLTGGSEATVVSTVNQAIHTVTQDHPRACILVTGSHYLVGCVLTDLQDGTRSASKKGLKAS